MSNQTERPTVTRFALHTPNTTPPMFVHLLQQYTMPSATDNENLAKTWASARGAMTAAKRHGLTNVEAVPVQRDAADW